MVKKSLPIHSHPSPPSDGSDEPKPELPSSSNLNVVLFAVSMTTFFVLLLFGLTILFSSLFFYYQARNFSQHASVPLSELRTTLATGLRQSPQQTNNYVNVLLLGTDNLPTRGEVPPLTDTMMLISLNLANGQVRTLPLPRDLWLSDLQTRINALYFYGFERYPETPEKFPEEVIASLTGLPIHHTVVLSLEQVAHVIDVLGGIDITIPQGFTDPLFPKTDVDVTTETDPAKLYEVVEFKPGKQRMDGQTALKYIRSRHSEGLEGTDTARGQRQQLVIESVVAQVTSPAVLLNPKLMGTLYNFYLVSFGTQLPPTELIAIAKSLYPVLRDGQISFLNATLSYYPADPEGQTYHPPVSETKNQWVYLIKNTANWQQEVQRKLNP